MGATLILRVLCLIAMANPLENPEYQHFYDQEKMIRYVLGEGAYRYSGALDYKLAQVTGTGTGQCDPDPGGGGNQDADLCQDENDAGDPCC